MFTAIITISTLTSLTAITAQTNPVQVMHASMKFDGKGKNFKQGLIKTVHARKLRNEINNDEKQVEAVNKVQTVTKDLWSALDAGKDPKPYMEFLEEFIKFNDQIEKEESAEKKYNDAEGNKVAKKLEKWTKEEDKLEDMVKGILEAVIGEQEKQVIITAETKNPDFEVNLARAKVKFQKITNLATPENLGAETISFKTFLENFSEFNNQIKKEESAKDEWSKANDAQKEFKESSLDGFYSSVKKATEKLDNWTKEQDELLVMVDGILAANILPDDYVTNITNAIATARVQLKADEEHLTDLEAELPAFEIIAFLQASIDAGGSKTVNDEMEDAKINLIDLQTALATKKNSFLDFEVATNEHSVDDSSNVSNLEVAQSNLNDDKAAVQKVIDKISTQYDNLKIGEPSTPTTTVSQMSVETSGFGSSHASSVDSLLISTATLLMCAMVTLA